MASPLQNAIDFFRDFGFFDIVLPFLFVFTIIFAILEKTRILGTEKDDGKTPKKNLDSMVAFVVAMLVVATNRVVSIINESLPNVVLLVVGFVSFLILIGTFWSGEKNFGDTHKGWYKAFTIISFIFLIFVFLSAIKNDSGESWLSFGWNYIQNNWGGSVISSFIFLIVLIFAIAYITSGSRKKQGAES